MKRALITGITGQDGSYLAELLIEKGYEVHGVVRRISQPNLSNLADCIDQVTLHTGDMTDGGSIAAIVRKVWPDEIYNLAAMSQVRDSYDHPEVTHDINCGGLLRIMETCRAVGLDAAIYQACSSEMFGRVMETPQTELTPFRPRSPYGASKAAAYNLARVWREAYGTRVSCGILFNHESPRRGEAFLSRKVCKAAAEIAAGKRDSLKLGNLSAVRDWGYAKEFVEWIWRIMQYREPDDFVIATGETHSVKDFVAEAFKCAGLADWERYVQYDDALTRPAEVDLLHGDATKSAQTLGFTPQVMFSELVKIMVEAEMTKLKTTTIHDDDRRTLEAYPEAKIITAKKDTTIGGHFHKRKTELFILSQGDAMLIREGHMEQMKIGQIYTVVPGVFHEFQIREGSVLVGINSQEYDPADDHARS
jgi:GDPmannose 4,6-dehydratase